MTENNYKHFAKEIYDRQKPIIESKYAMPLPDFSIQEGYTNKDPIKNIGGNTLVINPDTLDNLVKNAQYRGLEKEVSKIILEYSTTQELLKEIVKKKNNIYLSSNVENKMFTEGFVRALNFDHLKSQSIFEKNSLEASLKQFLYPRFFKEENDKYPSAKEFLDHLKFLGFNRTYILYLEKIQSN